MVVNRQREYWSTLFIITRQKHSHKAQNISRCNSNYYAIHHHYAIRFSAFSSYHRAQKNRREKKKEKKNVTMTVNTENNEYSKATYKIKYMRYEIVWNSM